MSRLVPQHRISQEQVQLSAFLPVRVQVIDRLESEVPPHDHEFCEVVLVRAGGAVHHSDHGQWALQPGDLLVVKPGQVHAYGQVDGLGVFNVYYLAEPFVRDGLLATEAPELCTAFLGHHLFPQADPAPLIQARLEGAVLDLVTAELSFLAGCSGLEPGAAVMLRASLLKVFAVLTAAVAAAADLAGSPVRHPLVQHVLACSERALADGRASDIATWAAQRNCTADHLTRVFRSLSGETPSAFHQRRRLQRAAEGLIHGESSMTAIALDLGFADSAHFTRSFREAFGMTPTAYRRRFQGD